MKTKAALEQEAAATAAKEKEKDRLYEEKWQATLRQWRSEGRWPKEEMAGYVNIDGLCIYHDGYGHFVETGVFEGEEEKGLGGVSPSAMKMNPQNGESGQEACAGES